MKNWKRLFTTLLALVLIFAATAVTAQAVETSDFTATKTPTLDYAASGDCGPDLTWTLDETGHLTISGTGDMYEDLYAPWYPYAETVKSATVGEGVTGLRSCAFEYCYNMTSISLPSTLKTIDYGTFFCCYGLTSVTLPYGLQTIGEQAFAYCEGITSIHIPGSVTYIGDGAFLGMYALSTLTVASANPNYCVSDNVLYTKDMTALIQCPASRTGTFTVPSSVTRIGAYAFEGAELTEITLPEGLTRIGYDAFWNTAIETLHIPASVEVLDGSIAGSFYLETITVAADNAHYASKDGVLYTKNMQELITCPPAKTGSFTIPASVTRIGNSAFEFTSLTSITMQSGVQEIGDFAFSDSFTLEEITVPATVTYVDYYAFAWAYALEKVVFLGDAPEFGEDSFYDTTTTVYYPKGNSTWNDVITQNYGGTITWVASGSSTPTAGFVDVEPGKWYATPVTWAVSNGITSGTSSNTFGPNDSCTRAQVVMFLWAANDRPAPTSTTNPFSDIKSSKYYYDAVLWAVEKGITGGAGNGTFAPDRVVTRAEFVTMLWNALDKPSVSIANPFPDVVAGKWYATPVLWAYANGITSGMKDGTFGVNEPCTRAQVVTFLYSAYGK